MTLLWDRCMMTKFNLLPNFEQFWLFMKEGMDNESNLSLLRIRQKFSCERINFLLLACLLVKPLQWKCVTGLRTEWKCNLIYYNSLEYIYRTQWNEIDYSTGLNNRSILWWDSYF